MPCLCNYNTVLWFPILMKFSCNHSQFPVILIWKKEDTTQWKQGFAKTQYSLDTSSDTSAFIDGYFVSEENISYALVSTPWTFCNLIFWISFLHIDTSPLVPCVFTLSFLSPPTRAVHWLLYGSSLVLSSSHKNGPLKQL